MTIEQISDRQIGKDIAIIEHKSGITESGSSVTNSTTGIEQERFMKEMQRVIPVGGFLAESMREGFGKMVRVERECSHTCGKKAVESKGQERFVKDRHQWLGKEIRQRCKTRSKTSSQNKGGRGTHAGSSVDFSTRRRIESAAQAAPNPLSMFTTVTPLAQLFTIPSRAAIPSKLAP